jgi:hypothetical protein
MLNLRHIIIALFLSNFIIPVAMSADLQELLQGPISPSAPSTAPIIDSPITAPSTNQPSTVDGEAWPTGTIEEKQSTWRSRLLGKLFVETLPPSSTEADVCNHPPSTNLTFIRTNS